MCIKVVNGWKQSRQIVYSGQKFLALGCKIFNMDDNHKVDDFIVPLKKLDWHIYADNKAAC